jgi:transcription termination/antitermination protein NusG
MSFLEPIESPSDQPTEAEADALPEWARVSTTDDTESDESLQQAFLGTGDSSVDEAADSELEIEGEEVSVDEEIMEVAVEAGPADLADAELLEVIELVEDEEPAAPAEPSPYDRPGDWFVVHTYAGYENKVKQNLASRVRSMNVEGRIFEVVIPMEDVIEFKGGRKVVAQKKLFPGYLYVRMDLDDDSWYVVRNTPGVTGFVGNGARPTPLSRKEVENVLGVGKEEPGVEKKVRPRLEFEVGEQVRVITGPFADFNGAISDIDVARSKLTVLVNIFGRETPVELELGQVAKL